MAQSLRYNICMQRLASSQHRTWGTTLSGDMVGDWAGGFITGEAQHEEGRAAIGESNADDGCQSTFDTSVPQAETVAEGRLVSFSSIKGKGSVSTWA